jgi:hypothetical protein
MSEVPKGARYTVEPIRPRPGRRTSTLLPLWEREPRTSVGLLAAVVWVVIVGIVLGCHIAGVSVPEMFAAVWRFVA